CARSMSDARSTARPNQYLSEMEELGRIVKRGERALMLCMPITRKRRDEDADEEQTFTSFIYSQWR
ncbi:MAG TPA: hypothetical protein VFM05_04600, partial [Candidatus Saccharimonadales bacterium]|nr:hypothetical protein [Candidatus Saccharimonadales bacterium]